MRLSRGQWVTAALSGAFAVFGFWSFAITLPPVPDPLLQDAGVISSAEAPRPRGKIAVIWIRVAPSGREYAYPDILGNVESVWEQIRSGPPVEVLYSNPQDPELWGLKVGGSSLITPQEALRARRQNGLWGLGIGFAFLGCLVYMLLVEGRRDAA
jgi:hypothetical protein